MKQLKLEREWDIATPRLKRLSDDHGEMRLSAGDQMPGIDDVGQSLERAAAISAFVEATAEQALASAADDA